MLQFFLFSHFLPPLPLSPFSFSFESASSYQPYFPCSSFLLLLPLLSAQCPPPLYFFLILSPQPSPLTHMLLSLRLPSSAPPAVSYSDSDIITLVVTGFICTLWTYTSAWLIVRGPGPAEPRPDRDRVTDRMVLKTTPARVPLDIFSLLAPICQTQCRFKTCPQLRLAWNNKLRQSLATGPTRVKIRGNPEKRMSK